MPSMNTVPEMLTGATSEKSLFGEPLTRVSSTPSMPSTMPTIWLLVALGFDATPGRSRARADGDDRTLPGHAVQRSGRLSGSQTE